MKSVKQAVDGARPVLNGQLCAVFSVHRVCAANIVTCDIPDIVHCANLPVLCPPNPPNQIETEPLFHSFTLLSIGHSRREEVILKLKFWVFTRPLHPEKDIAEATLIDNH